MGVVMKLENLFNRLKSAWTGSVQTPVDKSLNPAQIMMSSYDPDNAYPEDTGSKRISAERAGYRAVLGARLGT